MAKEEIIDLGEDEYEVKDVENVTREQADSQKPESTQKDNEKTIPKVSEEEKAQRNAKKEEKFAKVDVTKLTLQEIIGELDKLKKRRNELVSIYGIKDEEIKNSKNSEKTENFKRYEENVRKIKMIIDKFNRELDRRDKQKEMEKLIKTMENSIKKVEEIKKSIEELEKNKTDIENTSVNNWKEKEEKFADLKNIDGKILVNREKLEVEERKLQTATQILEKRNAKDKAELEKRKAKEKEELEKKKAKEKEELEKRKEAIVEIKNLTKSIKTLINEKNKIEAIFDNGADAQVRAEIRRDLTKINEELKQKSDKIKNLQGKYSISDKELNPKSKPPQNPQQGTQPPQNPENKPPQNPQQGTQPPQNPENKPPQNPQQGTELPPKPKKYPGTEPNHPLEQNGDSFLIPNETKMEKVIDGLAQFGSMVAKFLKGVKKLAGKMYKGAKNKLGNLRPKKKEPSENELKDPAYYTESEEWMKEKKKAKKDMKGKDSEQTLEESLKKQVKEMTNEQDDNPWKVVLGEDDIPDMPDFSVNNGNNNYDFKIKVDENWRERDAR